MPAPEPLRDDARRDPASDEADLTLTDLALIEAAAVEAGRIALVLDGLDGEPGDPRRLQPGGAPRPQIAA